MAKWITIIMVLSLAITVVACGGGGESDDALEIKVLKAGESLSGGYQYDISFIPPKLVNGFTFIPQPKGIMMPANSNGEVVVSFYAETVEELNQNFNSWMEEFKQRIEANNLGMEGKNKAEFNLMKVGEKITIQ